jgi:IS5 family transposase
MQRSGRPRRAKDGGPPDQAQRNFTDPDSRIQPTKDGFIAGYNGQIAVDAAHQIIVAQRLQTNPADFAGLIPLTEQATAHLGRKLREVSGDSGFATEDNLAGLAARNIRAYLPPPGKRAPQQPRLQAMAATLKRAGHRSRYRLRKQVVEPVFGQIKQARGFRQFLLRGLVKVRGEWAMICTAHNLLKLARATATA